MPVPKRRQATPTVRAQSSTRLPAVIWIALALALAVLLVVIFRENSAGHAIPERRFDSDVAQASGGAVLVVDGDTIRIDRKRIRLHGIDAPELRQLCFANDVPWQCGRAAAAELSQLIHESALTCIAIEKDHFGRTVAQCFKEDGTDIQKWMVSHGWAYAYSRFSDRYVLDQVEAAKNRRGVHAGVMESPEAWRQRARR